MTKTIAVVDGNSLMHRAFHAVPPAMTAPDGTPTNAAFGFMSMLLKFIEVANPDALICAFDRGRPAMRTEALEQYKAQRPPMDPTLKVQFPIIEALLESMNIPVIAKEGWEGDDILGTVSRRAEAKGYDTLLVTGDKDAYQLATDHTRIMTTKKGITDVVIYGPAEVEERYGVTPDQFADFLGLKGDKSDNIPGVPGIGDKKAASMLQQFGNLEGIYENLSAFKGKQLENLENNKDAAFLSRQVATIICDADIEVDLDAISFPDFDPVRVTEAFQEYRFSAHLNKVLGLQDMSCAETSLVAWEPLLEGSDAVVALNAALESNEQVAVAFAEDAQASIFGPEISVAFNTKEGTALFKGEEAIEQLARVIEMGSFSCYDAKSILKLVFPTDSFEPAHVASREVLDARFFDIALASYVADSSAAHDFEAVLGAFGILLPSPTDDPDKALALRAAGVATVVEPLHEKLTTAKPTNDDPSDSWSVYETIDRPLVGVLTCMERVGAALDTDHLARIAASTQTEIDGLRSEIYELAGEEFNVDSPKQLSHILFEVLGLTPLKKTQRGYSTNVTVLKELAKVHELPEKVMHYREFAKIKSTYVDALPRLLAGDDRVHTSFNEMVTTTGRLSSSDPNLQNIPVRTDYGRSIRECFVPLCEGDVFMSADYSQIELRLLAHLSGDVHLIEAFNSGEDFHAQTASRVFGVPVEEITPQLRSRAKAVNFGIVYGQQAFGLSQSLDIPFGEAKDMIDRYFDAYPGVRSYLDDVVADAYRDGYVATMFGRRRYIPELRQKNAQQRNFGERTAMNHPMQGSAADIIKLAMRKVQNELIDGGYDTKLMLQVHDELDLSVPQAEVQAVGALVESIMESVVSLSVPLLVDVSVGPNWALAH